MKSTGIAIKVLLGCVVLGWLIVNLTRDPAQFAGVAIVGLATGAVYGFLALGYSLVYGLLRLFYFPQGDLFGAGAMVSVGLIVALAGQRPSLGVGATAGIMVLIVIVAGALSSALNLAIEAGVYRPMRRRAATRLEPLIASLGCVYVLENAISAIWGTDFRAVPPLFPQGAAITIGQFQVLWSQVFILATTAVTLAGLRRFILHSRTGQALRAVAQDADAAATLGIDPRRAITTGYVIGGLLVGVGVMLFVSQAPTLRYDSGFSIGLFAFTAAILGGLRSLPGAVVGGLVIGLIQAFNEGLSWMTPGSSWSAAIVFGALVIILIVRPQGLLGRRDASDSLTAAASSASMQRRRPRRRPRVSGSRALPDGVRRPIGRVVGLALLGACVLYPTYVGDLPTSGIPIINSFPSTSTMCVAAIYATMAVGLNVVVGYAGLLDLGYVAFYATGAYIMGLLASSQIAGADLHLGGAQVAPGLAGIHLNPWLILLIAGFATAALGAAIGFPTLRMRGDYLAIVTFAFGEIIPSVIRNGGSVTNGTFGISGIDSAGIGGLFGTPTAFHSAVDGVNYYYWGALVLLGIAVLACLQLRTSRIGRAWIAIREDEDAAAAVGIPLMRLKTYAYTVGAFIGGVSGAYFASYKGAAFPNDFSFAISFLILTMVVLGGLGSVWGVVMGGAFLAWLDQEGLANIGGWLSSSAHVSIDAPTYEVGLFGLLLIIVMVFRPQGLLPERRHAREIAERAALPGQVVEELTPAREPA